MDMPTMYGPVQVMIRYIISVIASATEAKHGALYMNVQGAVPLRVTLKQIGHAHLYT